MVNPHCQNGQLHLQGRRGENIMVCPTLGVSSSREKGENII
jgi:hypothetical protein